MRPRALVPCQLRLLLLVLCLASRSSWALVQPTCSLKENCNLGDHLLALPASDATSDAVESHIASIFEDKVNYSLKLFADDATPAAVGTGAGAGATTTTVLDVLHDALAAAGNLSELHHGGSSSGGNNYTTLHTQLGEKQRQRRNATEEERQLAQQQQDEDEEEERGECQLQQYINYLSLNSHKYIEHL